MARPTAVPAQGGLLITEFMADNSKVLKDEDGDYEDWVEIFNSGEQEVSLEGYFLTDDAKQLNQWAFPAVTIGPRRFLIVICSGKDRRDPQSQLHTSFKLNNGGEDLLLVAPGGRTVVSGFVAYTVQIPDVSYGLATDSKFAKPVLAGATVKFLIPANGDLGPAWTQADFDDAAWGSGTLAVGFGVRPPDSDLIGADIGASMVGINASVYLRIPFEVADPAAIDLLKLRLKYDDGFAAFVNGVKVAGINAPDPLNWNSTALRSHSPQNFEKFDISAGVPALLPGKNILAIQGLNSSATNSDLYILPELETAEVGQVQPSVSWYFEEPTPAEPNGPGLPSLAPKPVIIPASGVFIQNVMVEISTTLAGGAIRYTTNGTMPDESSPVYTAPFEVTGPARVTARVFKDGYVPGIVAHQTYVIIDPKLTDFSSNIPLVICTTFGRAIGGNCGGGPYTPGHILIITPGTNGRAEIIDEVEESHIAAFRKRGSSTCGQDKFAFNVEIQDEEGRDNDVTIFDFPKESDYIMYAPNNFDRSLIRNPVAYWLSRQAGRWAARTRNVECFFHTQKTPLANTNYYGVYNFMEKNKRHSKKIDVHQITPKDNKEPELTGGYILRRDRVGPDEIAISGGGYSSLVFVYPKQPTTAQRAYMTQVLNKTIASLKPTIGRQEDNELIDFTAWLDHHIINWYPKNVDAFRLSGYFFKDRNGPVVMGPVWDYDRTMGNSDDDRARDPLGWNNDSVGDGGTRYFEAGGLGSWYSLLFSSQPPIKNTPWNNAYKARWRELRREALKTDKILAQIDAWAAELNEAAPRNFARWPGLRPRFGGFQGEIDHLKEWLADRAEWIDSQFVELPRFSRPGGVVDSGTQIEILLDSGGSIYYTTDGSDPKGAGDLPSTNALLYAGPLTITGNVKISARHLDSGSVWSGLAKEVYVVDPIRLMITELMYFPIKPTPEEDPQLKYSATSMEFIELTNVGAKPISLEGLRFGVGVIFSFTGGGVASLDPGQSAVVVQNQEAFAIRYGTTNGIRVAGQYQGSLSDSGERLSLLGPIDEVIFDFTFSRNWYPETYGQGYSLVNADPLAPPDDLGQASRWKPSDAVNGTPGNPDIATRGGLQRPGDVTQDGRLNITDVTGLLRVLFLGGARLPCEGGIDAAGNKRLLDANGDGSADLGDSIYNLQFLFLAGPPHASGTICIRITGCPDVCAE
ncbi:MAG: CotH kinase family protein [Planctomycetes bacterium]|nr:CotH kinase family protein [Planctomycetota bacterium]